MSLPPPFSQNVVQIQQVPGLQGKPRLVSRDPSLLAAGICQLTTSRPVDDVCPYQAIRPRPGTADRLSLASRLLTISDYL